MPRKSQEMIAAANKAGKKLMFNFNNRARPESHAMKNYVDDGTDGHHQLRAGEVDPPHRHSRASAAGSPTRRCPAADRSSTCSTWSTSPSISWAIPSRPTCWPRPSTTFITDKNFKGPWGIPDRADGINDVEAAAHGFVTFKTGQVLSLQVSWAEMIKREEVSVVFQGTEAGGKVERLFGQRRLDETAIDTCELYVQENGN